MRLPLKAEGSAPKPEDIGVALFAQTADEFLGSGCTCFDTNFVCHNDRSEAAVKEGLVARRIPSSWQ